MRTIKIAFVAPLTGDQSVVAIPMLRAAEMAINHFTIPDINLQVIGFDDFADPGQAKKIAEKIANDQEIIAIIGNKNSAALESAGSIYENNHFSFITPSATNYELAQKGWKGFFRLCANDQAQAYTAAKFAFYELRLRNFFIIHDETQYGLPLGREFKNYITQMGGEISGFIQIESGIKDVRSVVERVKKSKADGVYFALTEIESSIMAREMNAQKAVQVILGTDGSPGSQFPILSGLAAEGAYMTYAAGCPGKNEKGSKLLKQYQEQFGESPVYASEIFDAVELIISVVKDYPDVQKKDLSTQIRKLTPMEGATGLIEFDKSGNRNNQEVSIWQARNGGMQYIKSFFK